MRYSIILSSDLTRYSFLVEAGLNIKIIPIGIIHTNCRYLSINVTDDSKEIGQIIKSTRKKLGVTQRNLALTSGTGLRFIFVIMIWEVSFDPKIFSAKRWRKMFLTMTF